MVSMSEKHFKMDSIFIIINELINQKFLEQLNCRKKYLFVCV